MHPHRNGSSERYLTSADAPRSRFLEKRNAPQTKAGTIEARPRRARRGGAHVTNVDVCVCTFRRSSLRETLESLANQQNEAVRMRVIVADNDDHSERRQEIMTL